MTKENKKHTIEQNEDVAQDLDLQDTAGYKAEDDSESYKKKTAELEKLNKEYKDSLQRLQAEFENYQKRIKKENEKLAKHCVNQFICKLLPVLDSFQYSKSNDEGLKLIYDQLKRILTDEGLEEIRCEGQRFDPFLHEAMMKVPGDIDDLVTEEYQRGYKFHDTVIRPSKVKVTQLQKGESEQRGKSTEKKPKELAKEDDEANGDHQADKKKGSTETR